MIQNESLALISYFLTRYPGRSFLITRMAVVAGGLLALSFTGLVRMSRGAGRQQTRLKWDAALDQAIC